jgi:hypothetical protein
MEDCEIGDTDLEELEAGFRDRAGSFDDLVTPDDIVLSLKNDEEGSSLSKEKVKSQHSGYTIFSGGETRVKVPEFPQGRKKLKIGKILWKKLSIFVMAVVKFK